MELLMRVMTLIWASLLVSFVLHLPKDGVSDERVVHHGQVVDNNGGPSDCITCHDGLTAPTAHFCTVECGFGTSHSVFKEYPPMSKENSYIPAESLQEKGIRLFDGKVSCVSCHDLRKTTKFHLIMDNNGSALCFSCHRI